MEPARGIAQVDEDLPVDAAGDAYVCSWVGTAPNVVRIPLASSADGGWIAAEGDVPGEWYVGLEWSEPRDICRVIAELASPQAHVIRIEYWRKNWPTPAPERLPGARRGWIGQDDPYHGTWTRVQAAIVQSGATVTANFDALDYPEIPDRKQIEEAADYAAAFRRTLKLRLVLRGEVPAIRSLQALTPGHWRRQVLAITVNASTSETKVRNGELRLRHGHLLRLTSSGSATINGATWHIPTTDSAETIQAEILRTDSLAANDRTIVTLLMETGTCSFVPAEVEDTGPLWLPDFGVYIAPIDGPDMQTYQAHIAASSGRTTYDRVLSEPEQTAERAFAEVPRLVKTKQEPLPRYLPLGWDQNRQEFALLYNGHVFCDKMALKVGARDTARLLWPATSIHYRFATGDPADFHFGEHDVRQALLDGYLPIVISTWEDREFRYEQTAFVTPIVELPDDPEAVRGDEDLVLMLRFRIRNRTEGVKRTQLWFVTEPHEQLALEGTEIVAHGRVVPGPTVERQWQIQAYPTVPLRARVILGAAGHLRLLPDPRPGSPSATTATALYEAEVAAYSDHEVIYQIPFASLTDADPLRATLRGLDPAAAQQQAADYWRQLVAQGAAIQVPDHRISDFLKAAITHVALTVDREPDQDLYMVPAATYLYGTCANEACLQIRQLDWRGYHDRARAYLETFLKTQGLRPLDGHFQSKEGVLRGLDFYGDEVRTNFNYTLDHGFIMRQLAQHYWLTGDRDWAQHWAPQLIAACDFIVRERQATKRHDPDGQPVAEFGLLPAGHLEDNPEWRYWFAVNAWAYGGMRDITAVLAAIDHIAAHRLQSETEAYRADILAAIARARSEAPVVRLPDGTAIPHTPTRAGLHGRAWGWFRETAYGPLHLVDNDLLDPQSRETTWILKDLEDNLFMSRQYGRPVDVAQDWFSQGGVTIQANLLNNAVAYLRRGQIEHAVRAFFNNFAASLYEDVRCFTEHPVIELGHGLGPFYKTSDECGFLNWLRLFLVYEEGTVLRLARGTPRSWLRDGEEIRVEHMATNFGPLSYTITSSVAQGTIIAEIQVPQRTAPATIELSLRHPTHGTIHTVQIEGAASHRIEDGERIIITPAARVIHVTARYS